MDKSLRRRLTAVCAVSTGFVLLGMAAASLYYTLALLTGQAEEAYRNNLNTVYYYLRGQTVIDHTWLGRTETASGLLIRVTVEEEPTYYTGLNPLRDRFTALAAETALTGYGFDVRRPPTGTVQPDSVSFRLRDGGAEYRATVAAVPGGGRWFGVVVLKDTAPERAGIFRLVAVFSSCVVLALGCLILVAWRFSAWAIRPVIESRRRQNEFISAASHELRSPLAVMLASADAMKTAPPEKTGRFSQLIEGECGRLSRLTDDLLSLAGADSGRLELRLRNAEPETVLLSASERFEALALAHGIRLHVELPPDPCPALLCDVERLEQALGILLDNAIRYTPGGGEILCSLARRRRWIRFTVADSGPGVPDSEKGRVFERFYRADASRTGKEHYGLGLSIAREIAVLHRGSLTLADSPNRGASFTLAVPM